jgi:hypothetical protein
MMAVATGLMLFRPMLGPMRFDESSSDAIDAITGQGDYKNKRKPLLYPIGRGFL